MLTAVSGSAPLLGFRASLVPVGASAGFNTADRAFMASLPTSGCNQTAAFL